MNTLFFKASLTSLLLLLSMGEACSKLGPSPLMVKAQKTLDKQGKNVVCAKSAAAGVKLECRIYKVPARYLARLWVHSVNIEAERKNGTWKIVEPKVGRVTVITAIENGSMARTEDIQSALEQVTAQLNKHPKVKSFSEWRDCKEARLHQLKRGNKRISIANCQIINKELDGTVLQFKVKKKIDVSLPKGTYEWMPDNGANCGGIVRQVGQMKNKTS